MMAGLNKVQLIGHLGDDPQARSLNNGGEVVTFRLATSESWKDRDGNRQERTEWHTVVCFNENLGRVIKSYTRKGSKVYVEGQLQTRKWQGQDGNDRYSTEVVMQRFNGQIILLDSKDSGGGHNDDRGEGRSQSRRRDADDEGTGQQKDFGYEETRRPAAARQPQPAVFDEDLDDDVPF